MRARFEQFPYFLFNLHSVSLHRKDKISWKSWRRKQETPKNGQMATVWVKMSERVKRKRSQKLLGHAHYGRPSKNFFCTCQRGLGGMSSPIIWQIRKSFFLAKLGHQSRKRAERGWKSEAGPLSWKSGWKPSTRREFWAQRGSGSFFRFRDMAVWSWFFCAIRFYIVIFRLCSSALY